VTTWRHLHHSTAFPTAKALILWTGWWLKVLFCNRAHQLVYFVIDPNKFLNCGLLSSSFRVFSFQLFVLFRPAFQERGKEGESPRGHFIPALDKFDPARAQKILFYEISGLQHNQALFFNFIWIPRVLEDVLGDAQKADHLPQEELSSSELCLP